MVARARPESRHRATGAIDGRLRPRVPVPHGRSVAGASIGRVEAILFDWDGTLVNSLGAFHRANAAVMEAFGLPVRRRPLPPPLHAGLARDVPPARASRDDRLDEANDLWETTFADDGDAVVAFPGAPTRSRRLRDAGAVLGIVTAGHCARSSSPSSSGPVSGRSSRSASSATTWRSTSRIPSRCAWRSELAGDGHRPETSIYVGDAPTDMQMAGRRRRPARSGSSRSWAIRTSLLAAGAVEVAPSVAAWVDAAPRRAPPATRTGRRAVPG